MRHTRQQLWRAWDAHGWALLGVAVVVVTVAGVAGFSWYDGSQSLSNRLYLTLQLFTLNSGGLDGDVPWLLELARWGAPVVTALAATEAVILVVRSRSAGWRARAMQGHLVVVGLGDRGWRVVQRAVDDEIPVAAVEVDPANPRVSSARRLGVPVIVGDAADLDRLLAAGLRGADRLVCLAGRAPTNAAVAQTLFESRHRCRSDFTSFVEIPDPTVMRELQGLVDEGWSGPRQEFFNLEDRAGAVILGRHDPVESGVLPRPRPVLVVGASAVGLSVLGAAASRWEAAGRDVVDASGVLALRLLVPGAEDVELASRRVSLLHPDFYPGAGDVARSAELRVEQVDAWRPGPQLARALAELPGEPATRGGRDLGRGDHPAGHCCPAPAARGHVGPGGRHRPRPHRPGLVAGSAHRRRESRTADSPVGWGAPVRGRRRAVLRRADPSRPDRHARPRAPRRLPAAPDSEPAAPDAEPRPG